MRLVYQTQPYVATFQKGQASSVIDHHLGMGAVEEKGIDTKTGKTLVAVDPRYFRPTEVDLLVGDASKAKAALGWEPTHSLEQLCAEMVASDVALFKRDKYLLDGGHDILNQHEA